MENIWIYLCIVLTFNYTPTTNKNSYTNTDVWEEYQWLFAITAVTWWFWTIYTIRNLVITLNRASKNLAEARGEFKGIVKDLEEFRDDEA